MRKPAIINALQKFGMTEKEARLYLAMMEKPEATAADLHRITGVVRTKIYEVLEQMISKGFCKERVENKRRYFRAIPPAEVKAMFEHRWESEEEWRRQTAEKVFGTLEGTFTRYQSSDRTLDFIEVMRSREQINQRYLAEIGSAEKEVLTFNRSPYACLDPEVLEEQEDADFSCLNKGVHSQTIYMLEEQYWSWLQPHIEGMVKAGEDARISEHLPMKMFIFDRKKVMLALPAVPGDTEADFTMLVVEDPGFSESCLDLFHMYWGKSLTFEEWKEREG